MTTRPHPIDTVIGKLEQAVTVAKHELQTLYSHRPCGAAIAEDVLGFEVGPCTLPQGHSEEHQAVSKHGGERVSWADECSPWMRPTSRPVRQHRQR